MAIAFRSIWYDSDDGTSLPIRGSRSPFSMTSLLRFASRRHRALSRSIETRLLPCCMSTIARNYQPGRLQPTLFLSFRINFSCRACTIRSSSDQILSELAKTTTADIYICIFDRAEFGNQPLRPTLPRPPHRIPGVANLSSGQTGGEPASDKNTQD